MPHRSLSSAFVLLAACSAGSETSPLAPIDAGTPATDSGSVVLDAGSAPRDAAAPSVDATGGGRVLLNEVCPSPDYIEITNVGTAAVDISGWLLADSENGPGTPAKFAEALTVPAGTVLSPGAYLYVQADLPDAASSCLDGGARFCFAASFGISGSKGEEIYLLRSDRSVVDQTGFAANAVGATQSWSRLPDGTGTFAVGAQTPAAPNAR